MKIRKPEIFNTTGIDKEKISKILFKFLMLFFLCVIVQGIIVMLPVILSPTDGTFSNKFEVFENSRLYLYLMLYTTLIQSIIVVLWWKFKEKKSLVSLGFKRKNALRDYLIGMIIGFIMFSFAVGINLLTGAMTIKITTSNLGFILLFLIGFIFQGAFEEILIRGYLMVNIGKKHKMSTAIIISSIIFSIIHGLNPGMNIIPIINLILISIFFSLYVISFDNIWGACGIHSVWNFVQGNFYGIAVSGIKTADTIFVSTNVVGKEFINGGMFGLEGGIAVSIVVIVSIVILLIYMKTKKQITN